MYTDPGTKAADDAVAKLERRLRRVYRQAQEEIQEKLDAFLGGSEARQKVMLQKLKDGTITKTEYDSWMRGQVFQGDQWKAKLDSVTQTLADANKIALKMVNGESQDVFAENATYQNYRMEHDAGVDFGFGIYDSATVTRLIRERPDVLPQRSLNTPKDKAWNRRNFLNIISQGIIQGESIPKIAKRMAEETGSTNRKQMIRTARTTMTGAQNAGRIEAMKSAQQKGINVRKRWMATLDFRTRDAHGHLDGQVQDVDKPFQSDLGPIMYPGDISAAPANYYNCRCTLVNVYPDYQQPVGIGAEVNGVKVLLQGQTQPGIPRRDNISGEMVGGMTYDEWKAAKMLDREDLLEYKNYHSAEDFDSVIDALRTRRAALFEADEYDHKLTEALKEKIFALQDMKATWQDANKISGGNKTIRRQLLSRNPEKVMQGIESAIDGTKFGLRRSTWNGVARIAPDAEMGWAVGRVTEPNGDVEFRREYLHRYTVSIHEDLHLRSIWHYASRQDRQWCRNNIRGYEEGTVQLMTEAICVKIGIQAERTYPEYTNALRTLHKAIEPSMSEYDFAKKLFDLMPVSRYTYIEDEVDRMRNANTKKWKAIEADVEDALRTLKRREP